MSQSLVSTPSFFGDPAVDHAVAGFGAGTIATLVMHPLDLIKVRFQLADSPASSTPIYNGGGTLAANSASSGIGGSLTNGASSVASGSRLVNTTLPSLSTSHPATTPYLSQPSSSTLGNLYASSASSSASSSTSRMNPISAISHQPSPSSAPSTSTVYPSTTTPSSSKLPTFSSSSSSSASASENTLSRPKPKFGRAVYTALADAVRADGWKGLYRGLVPNLVGGAGSWGLYFLFYNLIKKRKQGGDPNYRTTSSQHLLAAAEASAVTAMLTNPIWVVKTRVFATAKNDPTAFKGLWDGLRSIYRVEGMRGLYRGSLLALVGVSNGSIQFATYEEIKRRRTDIKRRLYERQGREWITEDEKLTNTEYILASGGSKFMAIALTYPYQVVRARIQNAPAASSTIARTSIPSVIRSTYASSGFIGFYKGLGTNAIRILPGTCLTFVVYENMVWGFRTLAVKGGGSV